MYPILTKYLTKLKITKEQLDPDEKKDFDRWEKILSGGEVTVEKISQFCKAQISMIEAQWKDMNNDPKKNERLIIAHNIYSTILQAITSPEVERSALEYYLNQLINK
ncbi:MAG: hypothetical protein HYR90_04825 [Candidatus Andersenbacteria bacterium]|nr:hypothetical protein [Candidatus Andersenbacteria bacterium]